MLALPLAASSFPFSRDETTQWVVLAAGVLATLYVIMRSKSRPKRVDPLARQSAGGMSLAQQRQVERDMSTLMVEMLETARQMTAQLDTRAARLEVLLRQADERLEALKSAGNAPAPASTGSSTPGPSEDSKVVDTTGDGAPPAGPEPEETPPDPRHAEIYALADQGRSPHEIARSLDRPNGEVELILALRRP